MLRESTRAGFVIDQRRMVSRPLGISLVGPPELALVLEPLVLLLPEENKDVTRRLAFRNYIVGLTLFDVIC